MTEPYKNELVRRLEVAGQGYKGTDLGGLLQWAALHIDSQDKALADVRAELANEERERLRLEAALHDATTSIEGVLATLRAPVCPPIEFGRDMCGHINIMAGHGDPDYLKPNGQSVRHVDLRTAKPKTAKRKTA